MMFAQEVLANYYKLLTYRNWAKTTITVCPGSSDPFYIVTYYIKWVTTSWTHIITSQGQFFKYHDIGKNLAIESVFIFFMSISRKYTKFFFSVLFLRINSGFNALTIVLIGKR